MRWLELLSVRLAEGLLQRIKLAEAQLSEVEIDENLSEKFAEAQKLLGLPKKFDLLLFRAQSARS